MNTHMNLKEWRLRYVCTFLGFSFADAPNGLVDFEAVVDGELFDG